MKGNKMSIKIFWWIGTAFAVLGSFEYIFHETTPLALLGFILGFLFVWWGWMLDTPPEKEDTQKGDIKK